MAENAKAFKSTGDSETDEVLRQMAEDGVELPEFGKPEAVVEAPVEAEQEVKSEEESEESVQEEQVAKEVSEEDTEEASKEEEVKDVVTQKPISQTSIAELKKSEYWKEKAKKLEKQLQESVKQSPESEVKSNVDEELTAFAKEQNIDLAAATKLADIISKKALTPELRAALENVAKTNKENEYWEEQQGIFSRDFTDNVLPLLQSQNPDVTQKEVNEVYSNLWKEKTPETSLVSLFLKSNKVPLKRKTGESSSVRSTAKGLNMDNPSEEDMEAIISSGSDEDFERLSNSLGSKAPSLQR